MSFDCVAQAPISASIAAHPQTAIFINGQLARASIAVSASAGYTTTHSVNENINTIVGMHRIDHRWKADSGTITVSNPSYVAGASRELLVISKS
jgi:hypothetical protein